MKLEYGYEYKIEAILEKGITCNLVKPCVSQGFTYINSTEQIGIFKDLLFLANIAEYNEQEDLITFIHSDNFQKHTNLTTAEKVPHKFSKLSDSEKVSRIVNDFKLYSYINLTRALDLYSDTSGFKGFRHDKNINELTDDKMLSRYNNIQQFSNELKNLILNKDIIYDSEPKLLSTLRLIELYSNHFDRFDVSRDINNIDNRVRLFRFNELSTFNSWFRFYRQGDFQSFAQTSMRFDKQYNINKYNDNTKRFDVNININTSDMENLNFIKYNNLLSDPSNKLTGISSIRNIAFNDYNMVTKYQNIRYDDIVAIKSLPRSITHSSIINIYKIVPEILVNKVINIYKIPVFVNPPKLTFVYNIPRYISFLNHAYLTTDEKIILNNGIITIADSKHKDVITNILKTIYKGDIDIRSDKFYSLSSYFSEVGISSNITISKEIPKNMAIFKNSVLDKFTKAVYFKNPMALTPSINYMPELLNGIGAASLSVKDKDFLSIGINNMFMLYQDKDVHYIDNLGFTNLSKSYDLGYGHLNSFLDVRKSAMQGITKPSFVSNVDRLINDPDTKLKLASIEKNIDVLQKHLVKLLNEERSIDMPTIIGFLNKTSGTIRTANMFLNLINSSKDIDSFKNFLNLICHDRSVLLNMLGISMVVDDKDVYLNQDNTGISASPKQIRSDKLSSIEVSEKNINIDDSIIATDKEDKDFSVDDSILSIEDSPKSVRENIALSTYVLPKEMQELDNVDGLVSNGKEYTVLDKLRTVSDTIKAIKYEEGNVANFLGLLNNFKVRDYMTWLVTETNILKISEDSTKRLSTSRSLNDSKETEEWFEITKALAELPHIEKLVNDSSARDILTMELIPVTATTDDFLNDVGIGTDELLLPSEDFNYSKFKNEIFDYTTGQPINPVKKIDDETFIAKYPVDHPFDIGKDIGRKYLDVNVFVLKYLIDVFYTIWQSKIFEFGAKDLRGGVDSMLEYMQIYIEYRMPENLQEDAWRCFQLFRWYAEATVLENSNYKITFKYKPWKSELDTETISCPNNLSNVIINSGYVLENTANNAIIELQQEVKRDGGFIQFDVSLDSGSLDIYINNMLMETRVNGGRLSYPINKGHLEIRLVFVGTKLLLGNIIIDNCDFDDIVTEYAFEPGKANLGVDKISKRIKTYYMITDENFDSMKEALQGVITLKDLTNRLVHYYEEHHMNKTKGKRLTIKKGMI